MTRESMSLLLCHECYCWTEPVDSRCPECHHIVDSAVPDPPIHELAATIGDVTERLGTICMRRKLLPDRGTLYATTNGFYFLPHELEKRTRLVDPESVPASLLWTIAALVWSPLTFLLPLVKSREAVPTVVQVLRPQMLTPDDSHRLPQLLMENPGVFFISKKSVRNIARWGNRWRINRVQGSPVRLKPDTDQHRFHERMQKLIMSDTWQESMVG